MSPQPDAVRPAAHGAGPARASEAEPGAPLLTPEAPDGGAAVQRPQVVGWSRVVPLWRWFLFMLVSGGMYQLWWAYNTWRLIAVHRRVKLYAFLRTVFLLIFVAELYGGVFDLARERGYPERPPLLPLSIAYFGCAVASVMLPVWRPLFVVISFVLLLPVAEALNFFWSSVEEGQPVHRGVNPAELVVVALGAGFWALAVYATGQGGPAPR